MSPPESAPDPSLARLFATDPVGAVLGLLRSSDSGLNAGDVRLRLEAAGVRDEDARQAWKRAQRAIRWHEQVVRADGRYRWTTEPVALTADEALDLLALAGAPARVRRALVAIVRAALHAGASPSIVDAQERQADIDAVRAVAELAMEVEELTVNEASAKTVVHRVRARAQRSGLEPIERAGDESTFDRTRHKPIDGIIRDGASVVVVKPGYVWKGPGEPVLIAKAIVEE